MTTARRLHLRINDQTAQLLERLEHQLNLNITGVIQLAIKRLAEQEGADD